jgi:hypothetical protein
MKHFYFYIIFSSVLWITYAEKKLNHFNPQPLDALKQKKKPSTKVKFKKIKLLDKYTSEGASIGDVNNDGINDLIAGSLWWAGPDFKKSFSYMPVKYYPITGPGRKGYSNNFFTFPLKIDKDKWLDILRVGIVGQPSQWAQNPGENPFKKDNTKQSCQINHAHDHTCHESPQLIDIIDDSKKEFLLTSRGRIVISIPSEKKKWDSYPISTANKKYPAFLHGLGAGDVNGDGLNDILEKNGWWQQPKNWDRKSTWTFNPFPFAPKQGGAQMFAYDIDGDGDNDVITSLNGHSYGFSWYEQIKKEKKITFKEHKIMTEKASGNTYGVCFSQLHAMEKADIDGDGIDDIVTGKCFFAHNGRDPGAKDPAVLYWFRTVRHNDGSAELVPYLIDNDSGVGRQISCGDLNGDGLIDIAVSNKKGVFAFIQEK